MIRSVLKVASSDFDLRYARRVQAMTLEEAKSILGLPASYTPEEFKQAFRKKVMENHPDRGGSPEAMVQVNVAKDILEGKRRPTGPSNDWTRSGPGWGRKGPDYSEWKRDPKPPQPPKNEEVFVEGKTFDQAVDGSMFSVNWKVVSASRGGSWYFKFLLGQTTSGKWAILFLKHEEERREQVELRPDGSRLIRVYKPTWTSESRVLHIDEKHLLKTVVHVFKMFVSDENKRRVPGKFRVWPEGVKLSETSLSKAESLSSGVALKDAMSEAGILGSNSAEVAGRKTQVEIFSERNKEKIMELRAQGKVKFREEDVSDFFISVNGNTPVKLADATVKNIKLSYLATWIFNYDFSKRINLTRLRQDPISKLERIADSLTSEPTSLMMGIYKALEEMQAKYKVASEGEVSSILEAIASSSLRQASQLWGCPTLELLGKLYS